MNNGRESDELTTSVRRALDEQTDQIHALSERNAYLIRMETELRVMLSETRKRLIALDQEAERLRLALRQRDAELDDLRQVLRQQDDAIRRPRQVTP